MLAFENEIPIILRFGMPKKEVLGRSGTLISLKSNMMHVNLFRETTNFNSI